METTLFNKHGKPVAYIAEDGQTIYTWDGQPAAYLADDKVYGFNGKQLGWYDNGTIFDIFGLRCGFIRRKSPLATEIESVKPVKGTKPMKSPRQMPAPKPALVYGFSVKNLEELLEEDESQ
ncbi:MAG: hypothetical protein FJ134_01120 [Deltaproteobacteria bacterium]|nr:hypothetical protein [Deltaproteobacteria bacterium]